MSYTNEAADRFFEYAGHLDTSGDKENFDYLQGYLCAWLDEPTEGGVEHTGRNYEAWLRTALHIADAVFKDPALLDYYRPVVPEMSAEEYAAKTPEEIADLEAVSRPKHRPLKGIIDPESNSSWAFDKQYYEVQVWRRDHPEA